MIDPGGGRPGTGPGRRGAVKMLLPVVVLALAAMGAPAHATPAVAAPGTQLWAREYASQGDLDDEAVAVAVDHRNHNVYVTGHDTTGNFRTHAVTVAYASNGARLWVRRSVHAGGAPSRMYDVGVDAITHRVFVTGQVNPRDTAADGPHDYLTIAYSESGSRLWARRYDGPAHGNDVAMQLAVDPGNGTVYITGTTQAPAAGGAFAPTSPEGAPHIATVAYDEDGNRLWVRRNRAIDDQHADVPAGLVVDRQNHDVYVVGTRSGEYLQHYETIAYDPAGAVLWTMRPLFNTRLRLARDKSVAIAVDPTSHDIVVTAVTGLDIKQFTTVSYAASGQLLWTARTSISAETIGGPSVTVDHSTHVVYVTGRVIPGGTAPYVAQTFAYDDAGTALWTQQYTGMRGTGAVPTAIVVDASTHTVVVAGYDFSGPASSRREMAAVAYNDAGAQLWAARYHGTDFGYYVGARGVALDPTLHRVVVTGEVMNTSADFATVAYSL